MSVAFLIDMEDSYGERELALQLARGLRSPADATFVVAPSLVPYFEPHFPTRGYASYEAARVALSEAAPRLVVGIEWYNLPRALRDIALAGPWRFVTTDGTSQGVEINENPFRAATPMRKVSVPGGLVRLLSCPVNDPRPDDELTYHWALWPGIVRGDRAAVRRKWDVAEGTRIAMTTISSWSLGAATATRQGAHYELLFKRIVDGLHASGEAVELMVITRMKRPRQVYGKVAVRFVDFMSAAAFEELLLGCDLFISDSAIQMSAVKAWMAGIPVLILVNSRPEHGPAYDIFPLALTHPRGAWWAAIDPVEIGDADAVRARIAAAFAGGGGLTAPAYRAELARLKTPAEIVDILT